MNYIRELVLGEKKRLQTDGEQGAGSSQQAPQYLWETAPHGETTTQGACPRVGIGEWLCKGSLGTWNARKPHDELGTCVCF